MLLCIPLRVDAPRARCRRLRPSALALKDAPCPTHAADLTRKPNSKVQLIFEASFPFLSETTWLMDLDHPLLDPRSTVSPSDVVNSRNHGAYVTVAAVLCLILSLLFVGARLTVRWPSKATLGREDPVMPVALVFTTLLVRVRRRHLTAVLGFVGCSDDTMSG